MLDAERSVNLFPVPGSAASKSRMALYGRPGLSASPFMTLPNSPARALWAGDNRLFAAGGSHFYELGSGGAVMTDLGAMAGSTGYGPVSAIANGTQLLVCDASASQIYLADTVTPAMTPELNAVALEYLDGFYVAIAAGASLATGNPNQVNVSKLGDGTTWDPLAYAVRLGAADLTTQLATLNGQLWVFGQKTIEVWYNAGNPNFPFQRIQGATLNLGLIAPWSVAKFENTIMWLASDDRGYARVYQSKGLDPQRVSTHSIEYILGNPSTVGLLEGCQAFPYQENGHTFYVLQINGTTAYGSGYVPTLSLVYDLTAEMWHERIYAGPWPVCFASVPGFDASGPNFVGDGTSGKIFFQSTTYPSDGGTAITYSRTSPHAADRNRWIKYPSLELDVDMGTAQATLSYSNDGGRTFLSLARVDATKGVQANSGTRGAMGRLKWQECGRSRDRVFKISITDSANLIRIIDAYLGVGQGEEA